MDECWRVRIILEKSIKADNRREAKMKLIEETKRSKLGDFDEPKDIYSFCPTVCGKPYLVDVSASKRRR